MATKLLSEDAVYEIIVELYAKERTVKDLSKEFNVSRQAIGLINEGRSYKMDYYKYPIRTHQDSLIIREKDKLKKKQEKQSGNTG
tara:strand:- start:912 stop:1166 length:255 start_codon:yes stop_codon:yes gene_type:complete